MFKILICFFFFIESFFVFADDQNSPFSLSLDSRYFSYSDQTYDMRGLPQFGYEVSMFRGKLLEKMTDKTFMGNSTLGRSSLFFFFEVLGGYYMDLSFITAYHELGHASRTAAIGYGYSFDGGTRDFFSYYSYKFGKNGGYTESRSRHFEVPHERRFITPGNDFTPYAKILIQTAGLNSSSYYAGFLANKSIDEGFRTSHFLSYTMAKLNAYIYPESISGVRMGDVANILDSYRDYGVGSFTEKDIKDYSLFSFLASQSTWNYFRSLGKYFGSGNTVYFAKKTKIQIPDFETYFTSKGISVKTLSSYHWSDDLSFPFSIEHVFRGKHLTEYSLGAGYKLKTQLPDILSVSFLMGLSPGAKVDYQVDPWINTRLNVGANIDNLNSLDGERNIVSLKNGDIYGSLYLKATRFF
jgi:hypothetical protein